MATHAFGLPARGRFLAPLLLATAPACAIAQVPDDADLFQTLKQHDGVFFERGFNRCDLDYLAKAVHPELRFYHDQGGFQDYAAFLANTRKYICADPDRKPIRKVDADSLQVFPLYASGTLYAAIQTGHHRFYLRAPGKEDTLTGTARFTHVYVLEHDRWLLKEVLSYDHASPGR